jgi:4-aminobutyrate aminotransferase
MQSVPSLKTELPGPRARALIERDSRVVSPSYTRGYPLVIERASGAAVEDVDGNVFLDCAAGIAVNSTGHSHPEVVKAIGDQAQRFLHMSGTDFYYELQVRLAEEIAAVAPIDGGVKSFFGNSGTEAIEAGIKLARYATGRPGIIAFLGGFHGRTMGALSLTNSKIRQRAGFGPLLPMVEHAPYPRVRTWREQSGGDGSAELDVLRNAILGRIMAPGDVAAMVVEPIQGEGGYFPAPQAFLAGLREICDEHGILLIADEIQSGMGRTGRWWAMEHAGIEPDIVTVAKGIASGMPIGAFLARDSIWTWKPGAHGSTFGGNPVCAAAALATIELLESGLIENAGRMGVRLKAGLEQVASGHPQVRDIRGIGLMIGVEFATHQQAAAVERAAFDRGLLVLECGESTLRFCPAMIVDGPAVDAAVSLFNSALTSGLQEVD